MSILVYSLHKTLTSLCDLKTEDRVQLQVTNMRWRMKLSDGNHQRSGVLTAPLPHFGRGGECSVTDPKNPVVL
jgi:hypothetical protein